MRSRRTVKLARLGGDISVDLRDDFMCCNISFIVSCCIARGKIPFKGSHSLKNLLSLRLSVPLSQPVSASHYNNGIVNLLLTNVHTMNRTFTVYCCTYVSSINSETHVL